MVVVNLSVVGQYVPVVDHWLMPAGAKIDDRQSPVAKIDTRLFINPFPVVVRPSIGKRGSARAAKRDIILTQRPLQQQAEYAAH
jgi:hypothetical protein